MGHHGRQQQHHGLHSLFESKAAGGISALLKIILIEMVQKLHNGADGGIEMEALVDVIGHLADSLMGFSPQGLHLGIGSKARRA